MNATQKEVELIQQKLNDSLFWMSEESVLKMSKTDITNNISNVVRGICNHCYLTYSHEGEDLKEIYHHLYIGYDKNTGGLIGYGLDQNLREEGRNEKLAAFAGAIQREFFPKDNPDSIFNTFQFQFRSIAERWDYFTYTNYDLDFVKPGQSATMMIPAGFKGVIKIPFMRDDQPKFRNPSKGRTSNTNYIYLMLNTRSGYYKIGRSNDPEKREKTLQAEEPDITLIHKWPAPAEYEKKLHDRFKPKRSRGEWFELSQVDVIEIKSIMKAFEL